MKGGGGGGMHAFFLFCHLPIFVSKFNLFKKFFWKYIRMSKTIWMQIRPDILSGMICVQTVCKGDQQMTKVPTSGKRDEKL